MVKYALDAAMPVLMRPDDTVQVGWDPRRAVVVRPPTGLSATALADVLETLRVPMTPADVAALACNRGAHRPDEVHELVAALTRAGVAAAVTTPLRTAAVRVHGRGPLSDLLASALRCSGTRVKRTSLNHAGIGATRTDLVVLTDFLATDPQVRRDLHDAGVAHLPVRLRDGAGLVGPLVVPGRTSCLQCADLHRADRDAAWPAVVAQLRHAVGHADRATVLATVALALTEVERVITAVHAGGSPALAGSPAATLDATLEIDVRTQTTTTRRWTRHPECGC